MIALSNPAPSGLWPIIKSQRTPSGLSLQSILVLLRARPLQLAGILVHYFGVPISPFKQSQKPSQISNTDSEIVIQKMYTRGVTLGMVRSTEIFP